MFSSILPVYNSLVWLSKLVVDNVVLDLLLANLPHVKDFGVSTARLCKNFAIQLTPYTASLATPCNYARDGDFCYEAGNKRMLDLITIMKDVRGIAAASSKILLSTCGSLGAVINIAFFPLMDINFAKAVHNLANSVLYLVFQIPSVTAQRCKNHGPATQGGSILMCMPDFDQPINMMVAGIRNLGVTVDNWADVSSIIAERFLGLLSEKDLQALDCDAVAKSLVPAAYSRALFDDSSNRNKIVVGMTDGLYAVTDGRHAQYFNHYDSVESMASPNIWPFDVDTRFGVAAVTYRGGSGSEDRDGLGDTSTTMMGCACYDNQGLPPIKIRCALALKGVGAMSAAETSSYSEPNNLSSAATTLITPPDTTFEVVFQQRSTANYLTCAMTQISVQSVRWPATRFTGSYSDPKFVRGAYSRGVVDAVVWVSPLCTSRAGVFPQARISFLCFGICICGFLSRHILLPCFF